MNSPRLTGNRLIKIVVLSIALLGVFTGGMVVGRLKLPPYHQVRDAVLTVKDLLVPMRREGSFHRAGGTLRSEMADLESVGYLSGTRPSRKDTGVTIHDRDRAYDGLNLFSDGHGPQASLMDMEGRVLHRWRYPFERAFPNTDRDDAAVGRSYWRRVKLLEDGSLLAIFEGQGLVKVDRHSRLQWAYPGLAHHDMHVENDGTVFVLTRKAEILESINPRRPVLHDAITELAPDGTERRRISVIHSIERSLYSPLLDAAGDEGDILHTNSIEILDGRLSSRIPAFAAGHALVSIPMIDTVAVVDLNKEEVVWSVAGLWDFQHDPEILENGNMLVFDNKGDGGMSRVLEIDPSTQEIHWLYSGHEEQMFTATSGASQRLANGSTLVTESETGRAFEVTRDGQVVWEFFTPHRAGERDELIATLFELVRIDEEATQEWLRLE